MEQIIYYTFSTIPQVLGAIIALLGVFVIFKIQHNHKILDGQTKYFYEIIKENKFLKLNKDLVLESNIKKNYSEVLKWMESVIGLGNYFNEELSGGKDAIFLKKADFKNIIDNQLIPIKNDTEKIINSGNKLKNDAILIVIISGIIIIVSIIILLYSRILSSQNYLIIITILLICLIISVFIWNIIKSVILIIDSLKELY